MENKTYLIVNTSYFGDTLLTSNLIQNIKAAEPKSEIIFMANAPFASVAGALKGVDKVIGYDKKGENKGIRGMLQFYAKYKEFFATKNLAAAFVIYGNERGIVLAKMWGAKKIYSEAKGIFKLMAKVPTATDYGMEKQVANRHALLYKLHGGTELKHYPMQVVIPKEIKAKAMDILNKVIPDLDVNMLVGLCPISKKVEKDLPLTTAVEVLEKLAAEGKQVLLLGAGDVAREYAKNLGSLTDKFISLVDKTSLMELGAVLQVCSKLISVDTGTMHYGLALGVPTVCLFYIKDDEHLAAWAPKEGDYNCKLLVAPITTKDILKAVEEL